MSSFSAAAAFDCLVQVLALEVSDSQRFEGWT